MGLFSTSSSSKKLPWVELKTMKDLNEAIESVKEKPGLFFKHSTRCSISAMALNQFENQWLTVDNECNLYFIDLIAHRDVSNEIAQLTGVHHQSPQVIVLTGDTIIYDASHSDIDARRIETLLKK